tara:strand:- start:382 stop:1338 length:957 start_codon:yes stop_codon:yes gene_type:complete
MSFSDQTLYKTEVIKQPESEQNIEIKYNSGTYNLVDTNEKLVVVKKGSEYRTLSLSKEKPIIKLTYDRIYVNANNIHHIYVILQHIMKKTTLIDLSNYEWDYSKWKVEITDDKELPDWANILNCLLNLVEFNKPIDIEKLEAKVKLNDKRGWGGERPREINYKYGFPWYTSASNKSLKNCQRLLVCPFPIENINPKRKAVVVYSSTEKKCFTCGCKEGEKDYFGNICNFEKGHFEPHINGGLDTAAHQCKWCNSFYKDKINWNPDTGKPQFNNYAIMRDAPKNEIIQNVVKLAFPIKELNKNFTNEQLIELCKERGIM